MESALCDACPQASLTANANPMHGLYRRLGQLGLSRSYVQGTVLPAWWDDEAASSPSGYAEALLLLSRHLGLDWETLRSGQVRSGLEPTVKLKKSVSSSVDDVALARRLAVQVCRLAALGVVPTPAQIPKSGKTIRQRILEQDQPWVGLDQLLDFCWSSGIPVLHVSGFPRTVKRMHGMALRIDGRPMIVICRETQQPAWLLFILAHELGHIARGHVDEGIVLVDEEVDEDSSDDEEREANEFALQLLCGSAKKKFSTTDRWPKASALAELGRRIGADLRIDPGHVILNYAHTMGASFYPVANAALKLLQPRPDGPGTIRRKLAESLDWSQLPVEASEFVARMTQANPVES